MTADSTSALIVARPGPLRDGLRALMVAMPQIADVGEADDIAAALKMETGCHPAVVVVDSGLAGKEIQQAVQGTKAKWPNARSVFLADDVRQHHEAEAAGADAVLLKGFPATKLVAAIVRLLPQGSRQ